MIAAQAIHSARQAASVYAWSDALEALRPVAAQLTNGAELELLGKAANWSGDIPLSIDAWERAVGAYQAEGDRLGAGRVALMLRHVAANHLSDSALARGWGRRAETLLEGLPEAREHAMLLRSQGRRAWMDGQREQGLALLDRAIEVANRHGDLSLVAMSMSWKAVCLAHQGDHDEAFGLVDEAATMAAAGELGPFATGIVFCNAISVYRDVAEFSRATEWTDTAARWCQRRSTGAFPGICRVHRAEILRLRGAWAEASGEAITAAEELAAFSRGLTGEAFYELAEVRLRLGDLDGAEQALRLARESGSACQPARSLLLLARGDPAGGWRSIQATLAEKLPPLDHARLLPAAVELGIASGEIDAAAAAAVEMRALAGTFGSMAMGAMAAQCEGLVALHQNPTASVAAFRDAVGLFRKSGIPYETAVARRWLARALRAAGEGDAAKEELDLARAAFTRLGAAGDLAATESELAASAQPATAVTRCMLFTDIAGSTALVEAIGDEAWAQLVAWHDDTLRALFRAHGGEEADHAGDGFFVTFAGAPEAVACARAIQAALAEHRRKHGFAPRVRIGAHLAEVSRSGATYRGRGVHLSARLASADAPDEILVSAETASAAGLDGGQTRQLRLKGIRGLIEAVSVGWAQAARLPG